MLIVFIMIVLVLTLLVMSIYEAITERLKRIHELKAYANLPRKVLMVDVLKSDVYSEQYHDLRQVVSNERAAIITVKRMLMDMNVMKYRKEKL